MSGLTVIKDKRSTWI